MEIILPLYFPVASLTWLDTACSTGFSSSGYVKRICTQPVGSSVRITSRGISEEESPTRRSPCLVSARPEEASILGSRKIRFRYFAMEIPLKELYLRAQHNGVGCALYS